MGKLSIFKASVIHHTKDHEQNDLYLWGDLFMEIILSEFITLWELREICRYMRKLLNETNPHKRRN